MMVYSDERLLAEIALAGILAGKYKEAEAIAAWLLTQDTRYHESGKLILVTSWHACQKYTEIVHLLFGNCSSSLLPFKALSEYHLGLNHNLKKTIKILKSDGNNELTVFAEQFEKDLFL
ncbi:YscG family type III secretion protein [Morganella morganii]